MSLRLPLVIGVVGGSGSGKATVARALAESLGVDAVLRDQDACCRDLPQEVAEDIRRAPGAD